MAPKISLGFETIIYLTSERDMSDVQHDILYITSVLDTLPVIYPSSRGLCFRPAINLVIRAPPLI